MMTNNTKSMVFTANHQQVGHVPITEYMSGVVIVYNMGMNQLNPMAPRIPDDKFDVGLLRGPNSESTINVMPISVDEPSSNRPPRLDAMNPCQSWKNNTEIIRKVTKR